MRSIGIGAWGEDVTTLQEILNELGYPVKIDGIFGTETRNMVMAFQENNTDSSGAPLVVDGIVGPKTWWALTHTGTKVTPTPTPGTPTAKTNTLALVGIASALLGGYLLFTSK